MKRLYCYKNDEREERFDNFVNEIESKPDISDEEVLSLFGFPENTDPDMVTMADLIRVAFTKWMDIPENLWNKPLCLYTDEENKIFENFSNEVVTFVRED